MDNNEVLQQIAGLDPQEVDVFVTVVDETDDEPMKKPVVQIRMNKATYEAYAKK